MPELPEVETVRQMLKKHILNLYFKEIDVRYSKMIKSDLKEFKEKLLNTKLIDIKRKGKYLIFCFENDYCIISHLRMEGKFFIESEKIENKHSHVYFLLSNNKYLIYNDTRKFGEMILRKKEELYITKPIDKIGIDANDENIDIEKVLFKFKKNKAIKTLLLDQTIIAGLGNIYVDEVLFLSRIHPLTLAKYLDRSHIESIICNSKKVLNKAISLGGTTIKSFTSGHASGLFQNKLLVHTKANEPCPVCGTKIEKIKVNQRGTYYCPICQKFFDNYI